MMDTEIKNKKLDEKIENRKSSEETENMENRKSSEENIENTENRKSNEETENRKSSEENRKLGEKIMNTENKNSNEKIIKSDEKIMNAENMENRKSSEEISLKIKIENIKSVEKKYKKLYIFVHFIKNKSRIEVKIKELRETEMDWNQKRKTLKKMLMNLLPEDRIYFYKKYYENLAQQGTAEWLSERKIGGSTVATILKDPLAAAKHVLGIKKFEGNICTQWGTMMEKVAVQFLAQFIKITDFGSIPGYAADGKICTSFSPDGMFIWTEQSDPLADILHIDAEKLRGRVCLLEIKCPYMRAGGDEVPEQYVPQIQIGLNSTIAEICLFTEFYAKRCGILDFNFTLKTTPAFSKFGQKTPPIVIGFVGFYGERPAEYGKKSAIKFSVPADINARPCESIEDLFRLDREIFQDHDYFSAEYRAYYLAEIFPEKKKIINMYYRVCMPACDLIDFGSTNNFFYDFMDPKHLEYNYYYSSMTEFMEHHDCAKFLENEVEKFKKIRPDAFGIMCYKLFDINAFVVDKIDYTEEIIKVLEFSRKIDMIKENKIDINSL